MPASTIHITGTVTDSSGATGSYAVDVSLDAITIQSATVAPDPAPPGTPRTLTIIASSSAGLALTYNLPTSPGITFTPVAGQPNKFTFTA